MSDSRQAQASRHRIVTGTYVPLPVGTPHWMTPQRCRELEIAVARGEDLVGIHGATRSEIRAIRRRMEQCA